MDKKIFIATEAGRGFGFGHLMRSISIGQALREKGALPVFVIRGDGAARQYIDKADNVIFDWLVERERFFSLIKSDNAVIVDSYCTDRPFLDRVAALASLAVYVDDNKRIDYPEGMVVNGNIFASDLGYPKRKSTKYLLGTEYAMLRKPFWKVGVKPIKEEPLKVMVTIGGSDTRNLTPAVLDILKERFPDLRARVVMGDTSRNEPEVAKMKETYDMELFHGLDAGEMKDVMLGSDIAITAGGQTLYELARVGVPSIGICVVDNQRKNVAAWGESGFLGYAGEWDSPSLLHDIAVLLRGSYDRKTRNKRAERGRGLVDGLGSLRIAEEVLKYA